jgi:hypothetical protein
LVIYYFISSEYSLNEALAEAESWDPGWRITELEAKRRAVPDEANSALVLMTAKTKMPRSWPLWEWPGGPECAGWSPEELTDLDLSFQKLQPTAELGRRQVDALSQELKRAGLALAEARKVVEYPAGRYPIVYGPDGVSDKRPSSESWDLRKLLNYDVISRTQAKDFEGALVSCRALFNLARAIGDEPGTLSALSRFSAESRFIEGLERILAQGQVSQASLAAMQTLIEEEQAPVLLILARGERADADRTLEAIQNGRLTIEKAFGFDPYYFGWRSYLQLSATAVKRSRAALLRLNNQFVEIAKLPMEQQREQILQIDKAAGNVPFPAFPLAYSKVSSWCFRNEAEKRCAVALLAAERFRQASQHWPQALTDLVPAYLEKLPLDPIDGNPLRFRRLPRGIIIYSVGWDGEDNGGKLDERPLSKGIDWGLRLWDLDSRRVLAGQQ